MNGNTIIAVVLALFGAGGGVWGIMTALANSRSAERIDARSDEAAGRRELNDYLKERVAKLETENGALRVELVSERALSVKWAAVATDALQAAREGTTLAVSAGNGVVAAVAPE